MTHHLPQEQFTDLQFMSEEVKALQHCTDVLNVLDRFARPYGLRAYAAWRWTINEEKLLLGRNVFMHESVPRRRAFYNEFLQGYERYGPTPMARVVRLRPGVFTWAEHRKRLRLTGDELWFHNLTSRYGIADGVYFAHWQWTLMFWSPKIITGLTPHARKMLDLATYFGGERMEQIVTARKRKPDPGMISVMLNPREEHALIRYSLGDSEQEIAKKLGTTPGVVNNLLNSARTKLKAKSRPHAVRIAVLTRVIS